MLLSRLSTTAVRQTILNKFFSSSNSTMSLNLVKSQKTFGGFTNVYEHDSNATGTKMTISIFLPPASTDAGTKLPVVYWLSGLTCSHLNFIEKAGAQRVAAELGLVLVCPDTSPRGHPSIEGENDSYDFGSAAGFYVDATTDAWKVNYNMYTYVTKELPTVVQGNLPVDGTRASIFGHSMGGHGALSLGLKNPGMFKSVSAFAPICNPCECPWGQKAFTGYFGADNKSMWEAHDSTHLVKDFKSATGAPLKILCDQGTADNFFTDGQLLPEAFVAASTQNKDVEVTMRMQEGYDHSYFFISSFVEDHLRFHAQELGC